MPTSNLRRPMQVMQSFEPIRSVMLHRLQGGAGAASLFLALIDLRVVERAAIRPHQ